VVDVSPERFEELVAEALDDVPEDLARLMRNVVILVADSGPPGLLGLYEGIPLTSRDAGYGGALPDRITLYRQMICSVCRDEEELADQVYTTVVHEIAHHFGIDDDRLHELGWD
jgi:predicted Zn-dependent protease with MMP-like domain